MDGDSVPDLVVANQESDDLALLRGEGDGSFGPATFHDVGSGPRSVAIGDLNLDQVEDIVTAKDYDWESRLHG